MNKSIIKKRRRQFFAISLTALIVLQCVFGFDFNFKDSNGIFKPFPPAYAGSSSGSSGSGSTEYQPAPYTPPTYTEPSYELLRSVAEPQLSGSFLVGTDIKSKLPESTTITLTNNTDRSATITWTLLSSSDAEEKYTGNVNLPSDVKNFFDVPTNFTYTATITGYKLVSFDAGPAVGIHDKDASSDAIKAALSANATLRVLKGKEETTKQAPITWKEVSSNASANASSNASANASFDASADASEDGCVRWYKGTVNLPDDVANLDEIKTTFYYKAKLNYKKLASFEAIELEGKYAKYYKSERILSELPEEVLISTVQDVTISSEDAIVSSEAVKVLWTEVSRTDTEAKFTGNVVLPDDVKNPNGLATTFTYTATLVDLRGEFPSRKKELKYKKDVSFDLYIDYIYPLGSEVTFKSSNSDIVSVDSKSIKLGESQISASTECNVNGVGTATIYAYINGVEADYCDITVTKADNPITVKGKSVAATRNKIKSNGTVVFKTSKFLTIKGKNGNVTYKRQSVKAKSGIVKSGKKFITISKSGNLTLKKGIRKGKYKVKVSFTAEETGLYNSKTGTAEVTIVVK